MKIARNLLILKTSVQKPGTTEEALANAEKIGLKQI
jgi:hypothetical protein